MTSEEALIMIEAIEEAGYELNKWESDFLPSLKEQLEDGRTPSPKQVACLQKIYEKATESDPDVY